MPWAEGDVSLGDTGRVTPQENVEIVRRTFESIRRWDIDALLELYDAEIDFLPLTGTRVESGGYTGHVGVQEYFEEVAEVWQELRPTPRTHGQSAIT